jgi:hypothetical protein
MSANGFDIDIPLGNGFEISQNAHRRQVYKFIPHIDILFGTIGEFKDYKWDETFLVPEVVEWRQKSIKGTLGPEDTACSTTWQGQSAERIRRRINVLNASLPPSTLI